MPWLGFFHKMARAERYVVLDHVQFKKRYFENRNRIVSASGMISYLCVPVITKGRFDQAINQVRIDNTHPWQRKLVGTIVRTYAKAPYFEPYFSELESIFTKMSFERLVDLNLELIHFFRRHLEITTPLVMSSTLKVEGYRGSDLILQICRQCRGKRYLCGASGKNYLVTGHFEHNGIEIEWIDYRPVPYRQLCPTFVPDMSTLDLLFNHGSYGASMLVGRPLKERQPCIF